MNTSRSVYNTFLYENIVTCKLDSNNDHIYKEPKILPCGHTACLECILKNIDHNGVLKCNFKNCNQEHVIKDLNNLKTNYVVEIAVSENIETLTSNLFTKLQRLYKDTKELVYSDKMSKVFQLIEEDIISRIDFLQMELSRLRQNLIEMTHNLKENMIFKTREEFQQGEQAIIEFSTELKKMDKDEEKLKENLYKCENYLKQMTNINYNFQKKLQKIHFVKSNEVPDNLYVGKFCGFTNVTNFLLKLINNKPKYVNVGDQSIHGICNLSDEYLMVTSLDSNKLILVDKAFNEVTSIESQLDLNEEKSRFKCPLGICTNSCGKIYLCDLLNHRVLVTNRSFEFVNSFGQNGTNVGDFDRPVDVCHYAGNLYILDCKNKRIQEFTENGEFKREIKLIKCKFVDYSDKSNENRNSLTSIGDGQSLHKRPLRIDITEDTIAVIDDYEELFLYNFAGDFKQKINKCRAMCFVDTYLFTCDDNGNLSCYEKYLNDQYILLFKRNIDVFKPPISFMRFFNGHLVVSLGTSRKGLGVL